MYLLTVLMLYYIPVYFKIWLAWLKDIPPQQQVPLRASPPEKSPLGHLPPDTSPPRTTAPAQVPPYQKCLL